MKHNFTISLIALCAALVATPAVSQQDNAAKAVEISIEAQRLDRALNELAQQAGFQLLTFSEDALDKTAKPLNGNFSDEEALSILLDGTGLTYREIDKGVIAVGSPDRLSANYPGNSRPASSQVLTAQNQTPAQQNQTSPRNSSREKQDVSPIIFDEIVVTGTHIRGVTNDATPVIAFDRDAIESTGFWTLEEFVQSLPQNFGSGVIPGSASRSAANLRGIGEQGTLTLINGRRSAVSPGSGIGAEGVDLTLIPLEAVERIEVLTDGAAATYGSDAVAGVINVILRKDFTGAKTGLQYGHDTHSSGYESFRFSQSIGKGWQSGNGVATYVYDSRPTTLSTLDRKATEDQLFAGELAAENDQHSFQLSLNQTLSARVDLNADASYAKRDATNRPPFTIIGVDDESIRLSSGVDVDLTRTWTAQFNGLYSQQKQTLNRMVEQGALVQKQFASDESSLLSIDAKTDGRIFGAGGGDARLAIGAEYREEEFSLLNSIETTFNGAPFPSSLTAGKPERDVISVFAEMFVPLVGDENARPGMQRLELSFAGRFEDYSDFGDTANPKISLLWSPASGISFRGTWGTSFRAPRLRETSSDLNPATSNISQFFSDPSSPTGFVTGLSRVGFAELGPEESSNWTVGFDIRPPSIQEMRLSVTYFDTEYDDRIGLPPTLDDVDETALGNLITRRPPATDVSGNAAFDQILADLTGPNFVILNFFNTPLTDVNAIFDTRLRNLVGTRNKGFDLMLAYAWDTSIGELGFEINGSYLTENSVQTLPGTPSADLINSVGSPADFRIRNRLYLERDGLSVNAYLNYTDSYADIRPGLEGKIDSWSTVDLSIRKDLQNGFGLSLSATNLFDEDPPFVNDPIGQNYDPANAKALGRFVLFGIDKSW